MFSTANVLCSLRLFKLKREGKVKVKFSVYIEKDKQYKQKTSLKSYKSEIKILANPGLA